MPTSGAERSQMKVLIVGNGGREHALFCKIKQSSKVSEIYLSHPNGGVPKGNQLCENIFTMSNKELRNFISTEKLDLVVVGPEDPIVQGVFDDCRDLLAVFAPSKECSRLESSKIFAKNFMNQYNIPTAKSIEFESAETANKYLLSLQKSDYPIVIKYDGLAKGKGVTVAQTEDDAKIAIHRALVEKVFGDPHSKILIEDFIPGIEASIFILSDGDCFLSLPASQDYKRAYDNQQGPNTGGMGAYAPLSQIDDKEITLDIQTNIIQPLLPAIKRELGAYRGLLYLGLMIHEKKAKVLEFNVRFGDPETQALLSLIDEDLLPLLYQASCQRFEKEFIKIKENRSSIAVVLAAEGYPENPRKNINLDFIDKDLPKTLKMFHAGTQNLNGQLRSSGGRVLNFQAEAPDLHSAHQLVYDYLNQRSWPGLMYRKDIGSFVAHNS